MPLAEGIAVAVLSAVIISKVTSSPTAPISTAPEIANNSNNISTPGLGSAPYTKPYGFYKDKNFKERRTAKKRR